MERSDSLNASEDATFLGWQKDLTGNFMALYNITAAGHPSYGSTVTEQSLKEMNLRVPGVEP